MANICAARTGSIDDPNGSVICNPFMGNEEQLLNSLEPDFTIEVECHDSEEEVWNHSGDDVPMISLHDSSSAFQMNIQADSGTESDTDIL